MYRAFTNLLKDRKGGLLILNADDWGRDARTTDAILDCCKASKISSVSAMVFMQDSERAALLARENGVFAGLHLNLYEPFSVPGCAQRLIDHLEAVSRFLRRHRLAQMVFHPGLTKSFEYLVAAQLEEFCRLYGESPAKIDGHHHMHLCANVISQNLLPAGTLVRRNFSFESGEKALWNRMYRKFVDGRLAKRHALTDYFYSLPPLEPRSRLERMFSQARIAVVEVETHPVNADEYQFLLQGGLNRLAGAAPVALAADLQKALLPDAARAVSA